MNTNLRKIVIAALFAALTCAATFAIRIPTPGTSGYIHPGDALVILSGILLGPSYGFLAGGVGSALADLLGGYAVYLPVTFAIKGLIALLSGLFYQKIGHTGSRAYFSVALGGIADILLVVGGYLLYESLLYGLPAAVASAPANLVQGLGGLILSLLLYPIVHRALVTILPAET